MRPASPRNARRDVLSLVSIIADTSSLTIIHFTLIVGQARGLRRPLRPPLLYANLFLMDPVTAYRAWPKAELHLHLEGSVEPETMQELDPSLTREAVRAMYRFHGFPGFIQAYKSVVERLRTPEDYARITRALMGQLAAETVQYAEITLSAGVVLWKKQEFAQFSAVVRDAAADFPIEVLWFLAAVRHFDGNLRGSVPHSRVD